MNFRTTVMLGVLIIFVTFFCAWVLRPKHSLTHSPSSCAVIHKPAKAECPKGYTQEKTPRFTERNGSKEFACVSSDPTKEQCTDMLKGGESETLRLFEFVPEPPAPKPAGERKL